MIHHEVVSALSASETGGAGHFDVIEFSGIFKVYEEGMFLSEHETLESAISAAEDEAAAYDKRKESRS